MITLGPKTRLKNGHKHELLAHGHILSLVPTSRKRLLLRHVCSVCHAISRKSLLLQDRRISFEHNPFLPGQRQKTLPPSTANQRQVRFAS